MRAHRHSAPGRMTNLHAHILSTVRHCDDRTRGIADSKLQTGLIGYRNAEHVKLCCRNSILLSRFGYSDDTDADDEVVQGLL